MPRVRRAVVVLAASAVVVAGTAASATELDHLAGQPTGQLVITTASNTRPDLISGGDALVRVNAPADERVTITRDGADVTARFVRQPDHSLLGLVDGLHPGTNVVAASYHDHRAELPIVDHDVSGPVFAGTQQQPFYCETTAFGLAPAQPPHCAAPTEVSYRYRTTGGAFKPLADPRQRPADLAKATVHGRQVPYVVRLETGTIDRAVYEFAVLSDGSDPSPTGPDGGWNGRLVYDFGGGCNGGHHQGSASAGVLDDLLLSRGYGVASSSLNVLDTNCSPIISAEAAMMVKEHFAETYGPIQHTIGWGGSGGAIQQYAIADSYPGILDGIVPGVSFPDPLTAMNEVHDCALLNDFFGGPGASFTPAQKRAVTGYTTYDTCLSWDESFRNRLTPAGSCPAQVPANVRWDKEKNPDGVKCAAAEQWVNQLGRDPSTGLVRDPLDNVGVQYGLGALKSGTITPAQFAALNAGIGGLDGYGRHVGTRTAGDDRALFAAYTTNLFNGMSHGLAETPIIDQRTDLDRSGPIADVHTAEMSFVIRDRLVQANGDAKNQVIIEGEPDAKQMAAALAYQLDAMDRWLNAIEADGSHRDHRAKVIADRPADLGDGCYVSASKRILERLTYPAGGRCGKEYPIAANPRLVAGAGLSMNALKCRLEPLDFADYPVQFTDAEKSLLRKAFPDGVCDYGRSGAGQWPARGPWLEY